MKAANKPTYKRRLLVRSEEDAKIIAEGLFAPSLSEWADILEDYVRQSRTRKDNKLAMFKLQMQILMDIVDTTEMISMYRRLLEDPNAASELIPEEDRRDEYNTEFWEQQVAANRILLSALRDIGDGIAWRALSYNRPLLYVLSRNDGQGPVRYHKGLATEMHALGDIVNDSEVRRFVFHQITNIARVGDITAVMENGDVDFIEVKGKENPRGTQWRNRVNRQILRQDNLVKIANEGSGIVDGTGLVVKALAGAPTLILRHLRQIIQEAKNTGFAGITPSSYLSVLVVYWEKAIDQDLRELEKPFIQQIRSGEEKILRMSSLDFFEFSPHRTPLSVFPLDPGDVARILLGRINITYAFNPARFFAELEKQGWKVVQSMFTQKVQNPETDPFCTLRDGPWVVALPITVGARAIFEGMSVQSIVQECEAVKSNDPKKLPEAMVYGFAEEHRLWS